MSETSDTDPQYEKPNADGLQTKLERAMMFHRQGTLADAERIYLQILEQQPNHFDAVHLLGVKLSHLVSTDWMATNKTFDSQEPARTCRLTWRIGLA